jgi:hypothetical protein
MPRPSHYTIKLKVIAQVCKLDPLPMTQITIFWVNKILSRTCFNFTNMTTPLVSLAWNNPIAMCFCSVEEKINKHNGSFLDVHVVDKHSTKVGCTYFTKVLFMNAKLFSMKIFQYGKFTFKHNWKTNLCNQIDLTTPSGKKPLITNMMSSKDPFYVSWSSKINKKRTNI